MTHINKDKLNFMTFDSPRHGDIFATEIADKPSNPVLVHIDGEKGIDQAESGDCERPFKSLQFALDHIAPPGDRGLVILGASDRDLIPNISINTSS